MLVVVNARREIRLQLQVVLTKLLRSLCQARNLFLLQPLKLLALPRMREAEHELAEYAQRNERRANYLNSSQVSLTCMAVTCGTT